MLKKKLNNIVLEERRSNTPNFVIQNILKEYIQYPVLSFLYSDKLLKNLIFTGGSCLRICYDLPRLSENLDFDVPSSLNKKMDLKETASNIKKLFKKEYLLDLKLKLGDKRIYLKFPILRDLGLATQSETDWLYVKLELNKCKYSEYEVKKTPISKYGYNFVVNNYSLPFLMVGKVDAFLNRIWFKGDKNRIDVKGRDFYDLYWYLKKGVEPDWSALKKQTGIENKEELKQILKERIYEVVTGQKLSYDLRNFLPNQEFVKDFCSNYKEIMEEVIENY